MRTHLTHSDTRLMFEDAWPFTFSWATVTTMRLLGDPASDTDPCTLWESAITEDEPQGAGPVIITHEVWIATMQRIVSERHTISLRDDIIDQIAAVLAARTNDDATDELCQLDVFGFDAIVQVATLGNIVYG
jgi:hypothetical protein